MAKMNNYLNRWKSDLDSRMSAQLSKSGSVDGVRDQSLGPRHERAKIVVAYGPSDSFTVVCSAPECAELEANGYLESAVFGLLDVLMTTGAYPLRNIKLNITKAEIDTIHSSQMAFRWAGRKAATNLLEAIKPQPPK
jgi:Elongation factor G, domain IV